MLLPFSRFFPDGGNPEKQIKNTSGPTGHDGGFMGNTNTV